jgi:hypothetical protein
LKHIVVVMVLLTTGSLLVSLPVLAGNIVVTPLPNLEGQTILVQWGEITPLFGAYLYEKESFVVGSSLNNFVGIWTVSADDHNIYATLTDNSNSVVTPFGGYQFLQFFTSLSTMPSGLVFDVPGGAFFQACMPVNLHQGTLETDYYVGRCRLNLNADYPAGTQFVFSAETAYVQDIPEPGSVFLLGVGGAVLVSKKCHRHCALSRRFYLDRGKC